MATIIRITVFDFMGAYLNGAEYAGNAGLWQFAYS
jgi:hypothetical protein